MRRLDQGRRIPVQLGRQVQCIVARDVADFALRAAIANPSSIFNVTSTPFQLDTLLQAINRLSGAKASFVPLPDQTLLDAAVGPWMNLPLWLPGGPEHAHFFDIPTAKARAIGLKTRPLDDTLAPLLDWDRARRDVALSTGLSADQEALLLAAQP